MRNSLLAKPVICLAVNVAYLGDNMLSDTDCKFPG